MSRFSASVTTAFAPLSASRNASASGPNSVKSGSTTAPHFIAAKWTIITSGHCGRRIATRSPRPIPRARKAFASRSEARFSSP